MAGGEVGIVGDIAPATIHPAGIHSDQAVRIFIFVGSLEIERGKTDAEKLPGLIGGMISFMVILVLVFQDYDPGDDDPDKNPDRYKGGLR